MCRKSESMIKPEVVDSSSSSEYVYIRKNIVEVEKEDEQNNKYTVYQYEEQKVSKDDWEIYQSVLTNASDIADVSDALIELASLIGG